MRNLFLLGVTISAWAALPMAARGAAVAPNSTDPSGLDFFEKKVRPVLVQQCYKCHAATSEKLKGDLYVDTRAGLLRGGETGPAVVPGHPEKSLLIEAIRYSNDDMQMPPKNRLPASAVADLTKWVQMGAPMPPDKNAAADGAVAAAPAPAGPTANYDRLRREHWAWQPLKDAPVPTVKDAAWARGDIDRFLLAKLDEKGLKPVADADRATLIRRVTFDLTGLPPTPEDVQNFVADRAPDAYERLVDHLLASPAFGERWGRHWLDVARFAESTGSSRNVPYRWAWRYRDYVIDAFNNDKPYDRFITEQVAGDLLPYSTSQQHDEQVVATGFLALGVKDLNEKDRLKYQMDNVDEQLDVTTRSVLALTVACARCHDHKFDPIPTADYYALAGIFKSTDILAGVRSRQGAKGKDYDAPEMLAHLQASAAPVPPAPVARATDSEQIKALSLRLDRAEAELQQFRRKALGGKDEKNARKEKRQEVVQLTAEIESLRSRAGNGSAAVASTASEAEVACGVRDAATVGDSAICLHGEPHDRGPVVPRGFVSVLAVRSVSTIDPAHSGRLELAQWLTSRDNPLASRVIVNRVWAHLFGEGLVRTVDNFGTTGELPSHPELLDHLALQFMHDGWSMKTMIRQVVMSHAYQLASTNNLTNFVADPGNRLVWRMTPRRLDAEEIRDAMLAVDGRLDTARPRGSIAERLPVAEVRSPRFATLAGERTTRSVYLPILRDLLPPALDLFDFAEPTMVIGSRDATTVATQALFMMNDPFVVDQAHRLADRVLSSTGVDDAGRVELAYRLALSRNPTAAERGRAMRYLTEAQHDAMLARDASKARSEAWAGLCQALLGSAEFRYLN